MKSPKAIAIAPAVDEEMTFPDWRGLFPFELHGWRKEAIARGSVSKIGIRSGVLLNTDFAIEACGFGCGFGKDEAIVVSYAGSEETGCVVIKHDLGKAIVMELRLSDAEEVDEDLDDDEEDEGGNDEDEIEGGLFPSGKVGK